MPFPFSIILKVSKKAWWTYKAIRPVRPDLEPKEPFYYQILDIYYPRMD